MSSGQMWLCHFVETIWRQLVDTWSAPPTGDHQPHPHGSLESPSGNRSEATSQSETYRKCLEAADHFHITFTAVVPLHTFTGRPSLRFKMHSCTWKHQVRKQAHHLVAALELHITSHDQIRVGDLERFNKRTNAMRSFHGNWAHFRSGWRLYDMNKGSRSATKWTFCWHYVINSQLFILSKIEFFKILFPPVLWDYFNPFLQSSLNNVLKSSDMFPLLVQQFAVWIKSTLELDTVKDPMKNLNSTWPTRAAMYM